MYTKIWIAGGRREAGVGGMATAVEWRPAMEMEVDRNWPSNADKKQEIW